MPAPKAPPCGIPQHSWCPSRRNENSPFSRTSASTAAASGENASISIPYRSRTRSMNSDVSGCSRPVSSVNTRNDDPVFSAARDAMSISATSSAPLNEMLSPGNRSSASAKMSSGCARESRRAASAASKSAAIPPMSTTFHSPQRGKCYYFGTDYP